jgi:hypothetical protein
LTGVEPTWTVFLDGAAPWLLCKFFWSSLLLLVKSQKMRHIFSVCPRRKLAMIFCNSTRARCIFWSIPPDVQGQRHLDSSPVQFSYHYSLTLSNNGHCENKTRLLSRLDDFTASLVFWRKFGYITLKEKLHPSSGFAF